jgi:hypothetical protein
MKRLLVISLLLASACAGAGDLPNLALTPGAVHDIPLSQICNTKWGKDPRAVSAKMKSQAYASYGLKPHEGVCSLSPRGCEVDHLISRELAGADVIENLWVQPYGGLYNAALKDRLENKLHKLVCAAKPTITVEEAQEILRVDWTVGYRKYFGEPR